MTIPDSYNRVKYNQFRRQDVSGRVSIVKCNTDDRQIMKRSILLTLFAKSICSDIISPII